jgi:hypothetical protein
MNAKRFVTLILILSLFICLTLFTDEGLCAFVAGDNRLVSQVEKSVLIVAGKVSDIQSVQPDLGLARVYTDVTIGVSKSLKGKPNIDEDTVRFRLEGGMGIHPNGKVFQSEVSTTPKFKLGQEVILFIIERIDDRWAGFYDGLYPSVYPPYPTVSTHQENGKDVKVALFHLGFYREKYILNVPIDVAFRLIELAIKAPEDVAILEERIRPIKDIMKPENRVIQVESSDFLSMLDSELTKIEDKIKEQEAHNER